MCSCYYFNFKQIEWLKTSCEIFVNNEIHNSFSDPMNSLFNKKNITVEFVRPTYLTQAK